MDAEVERAKEMLQKPLYKFLRDAFVYWPNESTANLGPVMNLLGDVPDAVDSELSGAASTTLGVGRIPDFTRHREVISRHRGGPGGRGGHQVQLPEVRG